MDDDCNDLIDDGLIVTYYLDNDGDGFGNSLITNETCYGQPEGYVSNDEDCNDYDADTVPIVNNATYYNSTTFCTGTYAVPSGIYIGGYHINFFNNGNVVIS